VDRSGKEAAPASFATQDDVLLPYAAGSGRLGKRHLCVADGTFFRVMNSDISPGARPSAGAH
jgi:hypothetical protein